ncbi:MAG: hypothetical protein KGO49_02960 [Gammaproteobacteria bacterium]|nr:hypothetical protein [Gammaproteobacteria bacterium]
MPQLYDWIKTQSNRLQDLNTNTPKGLANKMNIYRYLIAYITFNIPTAFALGGGATVGPLASKANAQFPFAMLSLLIIIAIISRWTK